ncbi:MAG TPA: beta-propeller fold lactonase family protein [Candidatus Obscuribacterales bacterium]
MIGKRFLTLSLLILAVIVVFVPPATATRLTPEMREAVLKHLPDAKIRLDGSVETVHRELYLPLLPHDYETHKSEKVHLSAAYPETGIVDLLIFSNGWCYMRLHQRGKMKTVEIPHGISEEARKHLLSCRLPSDLIVPEGLELPKSLKSLIGDLAIPIQEGGSAEAVAHTAASARDAHGAEVTTHGAGVVLANSPSTGKIALLNETDLSKVHEFPIDGTPCGMSWADGIAYIADQTKNRVLVLDPKRRQFIGQFDLPKQSRPKGIAVYSKAKLLYVSESGTNTIAVLELPSGRNLLRTKVPAGPGRLALSPSGYHLLVLNVPAGLLTIINTMSQRVVASIPVGGMPSFVTISADSQRAYVSSRSSNTVSIIDLTKKQVVHTLQTGTGPTGLALSKKQDKLFVANAKDNSIWVFNLLTNQKVSEVKLPLDVDFPGELTLMPDGRRLLIASEATDAVGVLDVHKLEFESQPVIGLTTDEIIWMPVK